MTSNRQAAPGAAPAATISVEEQLIRQVSLAQDAMANATTDDEKANATSAYTEAVNVLAAYYAEKQSADMVHEAKRVVRTSKIVLGHIVEAWADSQVTLFLEHGGLTYRDTPPMLKATSQMGAWNADHAATIKYALTEAFKRHGLTVAGSNTTARIGDVLITVTMTRSKGEPEPVPTVRVRTAI